MVSLIFLPYTQIIHLVLCNWLFGSKLLTCHAPLLTLFLPNVFINVISLEDVFLLIARSGLHDEIPLLRLLK